MSKKYRPSNGTEGMIFAAEWCDRCAARNICKILTKTLIYNVTDPEYPEQWTYNEAGDPVCTSFAEKKPRGPADTRCKNTPDLFS